MSPTIRNQATLAGIALAGLGLAHAFSPAANAISDREACETQDPPGVYTKEGGISTCTVATTPGKNQGGVTKEQEESQKGSFKSSHPPEEENCVVNNGGAHCK